MSLMTRIRDFFVEPSADAPLALPEPIVKASDVPQMPATPITEPVGAPGVVAVGGYVQTAERSADMAGVERYRKYAEWIRVVPEVAAAVRAFLVLCGSPSWRVKPYAPADDEPSPEDAERAAWLERQLANMDDTPWSRVVQEHAMADLYGATFGVWTAKIVDGRFGLADVMTIPLATITRFDLDDRGKLRGIVQQDPQSATEIPIARARLVYSRDMPTSAHPAGDGALRLLADGIRRKLLLEELRDKGYEKDVNGVPVIWAPIEEELAKMGTSKPDGSIYGQADFDAAMQPIRDFVSAKKRAGSGVVLPSGTFADAEGNPSSVRRYDAKVLSVQSSSLPELSRTINDLGWYILASLGFEYLAMGRSNGTQSMHVSKMDAAIRNVASALNRFAETFRRDVVRPLWIANGWDPSSPTDPQNLPALTWDALEVSDVPGLVNSISQLLTAAGVDPGEARAIVNRILENCGLPPLEDIDPEEQAAQREAAAARAGMAPGSIDPVTGADDVDLDQED